MLIGAKELQIESLTFFCDDMFEELLHMTNCIRFLEIADKHEIDNHKRNALAMNGSKIF